MAMVQPNYYVVIARKRSKKAAYYHFCDVELGCVGMEIAKGRFEEISKRFPADEGWALELNKVDCFSKTIEMKYKIPD